MGKAKIKKENSAASPPKCSCDDPFVCSCGNRPPRPSRGHKWYPDEQIWGGKGHKQKGASGQIASVNKEAQMTEKGKTKVEMWQRLPSQLLQEYCKKQKRPAAKYKNIDSRSNMYKFRVIVPDPKDDDKDLFFVAAQSVANEEQAMEEGCLLALLHLTPNLPHERMLPEPYKTTWLRAVDSTKSKSVPTSRPDDKGNNISKNLDKDKCADRKDSVNIDLQQGGDLARSSSSSVPAQASTSLKLGSSYTSMASKRQQSEELRKQRNARIRRHEAIRMANQNQQVFMSAFIRQQIEQLLRGEKIFDLNDDTTEDADQELDDPVGGDDVMEYVQERLHHEGFTTRQAKMAYREFQSTNATNLKYQNVSDNEDEWDKVYEDCLQWLLVHLNEDQLPEGFDPRGRTLDVIAPLNGNQSLKKLSSFSSSIDSVSDPASDHITFSALYAISVAEARDVSNKAKQMNQCIEATLWHYLQKEAGVCTSEENVDCNSTHNIELFTEEVETLEAIYGPDCTVKSVGGVTSVVIALEDGLMSLEVLLEKGRYPAVRPVRVLVSGNWQSNQKLGVALHVDLIKFLEDHPLGEPMIFGIHSHVQGLLQSDELKEIALFPVLSVKSQVTAATNSTNTDRTNKQNIDPHDLSTRRRKVNLRPTEKKKSFWNTGAKDVPPAEPFPSIRKSLDYDRKSLPAAKSRDEFLNAMKRAKNCGRVLLVTGETGSGKSTQLPAFLLENEPDYAKIVVAQPRRIAATGVASRVAEERGESRPGVNSVGYVVRGDSAICHRTRLLFCTTGVLLRQLQNEDSLKCITHIVVDEVHERGLDSDVLLGLLKQFLPSNPHLSVVLMSATLDVDRFTNYFEGSTPHVHIPGRTFPVVDFTLEDALLLTRYVPAKNRRSGNQHSFSNGYRPVALDRSNDEEKHEDEFGRAKPSSNDTAAANGASGGIPIEDLLKRVDETNVDSDLIACLVKHLVSNKDPSDDGSILVFLPGVPEINNTLETIKRYTAGMPLLLLPLHGGLQPQDQRKVFPKPGKGFTKIILSTNVAETSVTIPDCTIVIDSAREKQSSFDPANRMPLLVDQFASKASLQQRRGRAGRVRPGTCYKLISKRTLASLRDHSEPEIRRVALDQTLLQLMFIGIESGSGDFMNTLLDPPGKQSLDAAAFSLLKLGALALGTKEGEFSLSPLGLHLAGIPAPPIIGKMLVMGSILGCRDAAISMAAGMSVGRSPVVRLETFRRGKSRNVEEESESMEEVKQRRCLEERAASFKTVGNSDHALLACIFQKWKSLQSGDLRRRFCDSLGLNFNVMKDMDQLTNQLDGALVMAGFPPSSESDANSRSWRIVHACAVAAMAPSQLVKIHRPAAKYTETVEGAVAKDGEAKELKFFIRTDCSIDAALAPCKEERVFIHPSSINFATGSFNSSFLVFNSLVTTSKPFLRDVTECSTYALLLFGGPMEVQASKGVIVLDEWVNLAANARIGSLMGGLRKKVDLLLTTKVSDPSLEVSTTPEMKLIVKLIRTDGLGT